MGQACGHLAASGKPQITQPELQQDKQVAPLTHSMTAPGCLHKEVTSAPRATTVSCTFSSTELSRDPADLE